MIQINGLTQEQCDMLDIIWSFQTKRDYLEWYDCLDDQEQNMANSLLTLLAMAIAEEQTPAESFEEANKVLAKFRLNKE